MWLKEHQKLNPEDFTFCQQISRLTDTLEVVRFFCVALASHGRPYKERIAETERVKERKRARVERGAGCVPMEPGSRADEQVAVRLADASGGDTRENQHDENRMRDIHVGKRGPVGAGEEQPDKLRKTVRFEQEAPSPSAAASSDPTVALEYPASGETQDRPGPYLSRRQVMLKTTYRFLRWMHSVRWMDESVVTSEKCWNDAGDLKRSVLNELFENLTCLNALKGKFGRVIRRS